jgi:hypothetical protein
MTDDSNSDRPRPNVNSSMDMSDDENDEYEPLAYPKFILLDGLLKQNPEIREGVYLALKLLHHDSTALDIFRPLARKYGNIDDRDIIKAITTMHEKGCRVNVYCGAEVLVSLKASFPLDDPTARAPEIGLKALYILLQSTEESRLSQKFLCMAKVLRAIAYLLTYDFTVLSGLKPQDSRTGKPSPLTPIKIGTVIVNGQLKGDAGRALEETLFGGRILPNPPKEVFDEPLKTPLRLQIPRFPRLPLAPENCKEYEIQQSYMKRVLDMISSFDCDKENSLKVSDLKASEENDDLILKPADENESVLSKKQVTQILRDSLVEEDEEEVPIENKKRKPTDSAEGHENKKGPAIQTTFSSTGSSNVLREYDAFEEELFDLEETDSSEDEDEDEDGEEDEEVAGVSDFMMTKDQVKLWEKGYRW